MAKENSTKRPGPVSPLTFMDVVKAEGLDQIKKDREQKRYEVKILKKLLPAYGFPRGDVSVYFDGTTKNPYDVVVSAGPEEMRRLWVVRLKNIPIGPFVRNPLDTRAFEKFTELTGRHGYPAGLIFPLHNHGDWIMHTLGCPSERGRGLARLVVNSTAEGLPDLWVETLEQFLNVRKPTKEI